ncbi:hypothetical protein HK099_006774, partial [Clydaea vesicula]
MNSPKPSVIVFSGGTAWNNFVGTLNSITSNVTYVLPISDDGTSLSSSSFYTSFLGGSTSEIVRMFGGPGIGDLRSRLIRLSRNKSSEDKAVLELLSHRLPQTQAEAIAEWEDILHCKHKLWRGITGFEKPFKHTILAFLLNFQKELTAKMTDTKEYQQNLNFNSQKINSVTQNKNSALSSKLYLFEDAMSDSTSLVPTYHAKFDFRHGSIGNFLLTGCRLFFKSLDSALFQIARILRCPNKTKVVPVISNVAQKRIRTTGIKTHIFILARRKSEPICDFDPENPSFGMPLLDSSITIIAASLRNGEKIVGQCEISHPGSAASENASDKRRASLAGMSPVGYMAEFEPGSRNSTTSKSSMSIKTSTSPATSLPNIDEQIENITTTLTDSGFDHGSCYRSPLLINIDQNTHSYSRDILISPVTNSQISPEKVTNDNLLYTTTTLTKNTNSASNLTSTTTSANLFFNKNKIAALNSPIRRVYYVNRKSQETLPKLNSLLPEHFEEKKSIIYACGSLYTSLLPSLIVEGIGSRIANDYEEEKVKILILNGTWDRETFGYTALDFILAITDALNYSCWAEEKLKSSSDDDTQSSPSCSSKYSPLRQSHIDLFDEKESFENNKSSSENFSQTSSIFVEDSPWDNLNEEFKKNENFENFESESGRTYVCFPYRPNRFITHLVYLDQGDIKVNVHRIEYLGITCIKISNSSKFYDESSLNK